ERDRYSETKTEMNAKLAMIFGGRVAEELIFGKENITSGASNDILQATQKARAMVVEWGMSDLLGPLRYSENEEDVFLGRSVTQRKSMSEETAKIIDREIRTLIDNAEQHARKVLKKNIKHLHNLAYALLEFESLSGDDVKQLVSKGKIKSSKPTDNDTNKKTSLPIGKSSPKKKKIGLDPNPVTS
ncbi:MAG: cell division protein FtsH, partial [Rickettsiales bacterium]|nr:cell division protein FtsH [Rickettsiales bacterium]